MGMLNDFAKNVLPFDPAVAAKKAEHARSLFGLLDDAPCAVDTIADEKHEKLRWRKLVRLVKLQSLLILGLIFFLLFAIPVLRPILRYQAHPAEGVPFDMASMTEPNLTDQSILSWSVLTITEVLTFGFGDVDQRILRQRQRFTSDGWESFLKGFVETTFYDRFKGNQLVLTTVPANTPVIVSKGMEEGEYLWVVEMPIIMTYATVDNIAQRRRGVVRLTIARIPSQVNKFGLGIKRWQMS